MTGTLHRATVDDVRNLTGDMMTTIERHSPHATLINVFTVEPQQASTLAGLLDDADRKGHASRPRLCLGQHSCQHHQWIHPRRQLRPVGDREADQALPADPTAREHMAPAAALASSFDPHLYTVESVHERR